MTSVPAAPFEAIVPARLRQLFDALSQAGVRWSLLRPPETLVAVEGDVDVLVDPDAGNRVLAVLAAEDFLILPIRGDDVHAADFDSRAGRFFWIHVQFELRLACERIPAGVVLGEVVLDPLPRPADSWLLWILLLRALLEKGGLAARHRPHLQALARRASKTPAEIDSVIARHELDREYVRSLAAAGDWEELDRRALQVPAPLGRDHLLDAIGRRLRSLRGARGLSIAVIGPDGAGKTTLVESLDHDLPFATRRHYMGLTGGRIPRADALRVPGLVFCARLGILWARYLRIVYDRRLGRIVLIDRWTLDGAVPSGIRQGRLARLSRRLQRGACPIPDLVLLLDASGHTMHARKGEYDPETLETWRTAYARLVGQVPRLELLNAEQPADVVKLQATAAIWRLYRRRVEES